eukprot:gene3484-3982_t
MEHTVAIAPSLPPIEEHGILNIEACEEELAEGNHDEEFMSSTGSVDERTSLIRSGGSFSYSYTDSHRFMDTRTLTVNDTEQYDELRDSSIVTDFQASYFLPSLMLSSYSTTRQSCEHMAHSMAQSLMKRSVYGSRSLAVSLIEKVSDDRGASFGLALFNLLPALLGTAIFTLPYAIALGGYATIPIFIIISLLADFTALLLVDSMYEVSPKSKIRKRTKLDYVEVARGAFGKTGGKLMNFVLIFYLFAVNIVCLVLIGKSFFSILRRFGTVSNQEAMAIFSVLVIPTLFIQKLSHLAYLSILSIVAIAIGVIATLVAFVLQHDQWKANLSTIPVFEWHGFSLALSIWAYTIIQHPIIPQVESSMGEPAKFAKIIHTTVGMSTPIKLLYAVLGAATYGCASQPLITNNIVAYSYPLSVVVNLVVCMFAVSNFPLNYFVVCDAFDHITLGSKRAHLKKGGKYHPLWILLTRPILVAAAVCIGLVVPYFGLLVGVLGSLLGILLVFVLPCSFHLKLKWNTLSWRWKLIEIFVLIFGCLVGCIGLYASVRGLYFAITTGTPS